VSPREQPPFSISYVLDAHGPELKRRKHRWNLAIRGESKCTVRIDRAKSSESARYQRDLDQIQSKKMTCNVQHPAAATSEL
jgi:hypothetical protein